MAAKKSVTAKVPAKKAAAKVAAKTAARKPVKYPTPRPVLGARRTPPALGLPRASPRTIRYR